MTAVHRRAFICVPAVLTVLVACSGGGSAAPSIVTATPSRVAVVPSSSSVAIGGTQQLVATLYDQNDNVLSGYSMSWSTSDQSVATVSSAGLATGVAAGAVTITASAAGVSGSGSLTVTARTVTRVQLAPGTATVSVGATTTLTATAYDAQNTVVAGRQATFSSSNTSVATVNGAGVVTGVAAGSATITGTIDGVNGTSTITVQAPGSGAVQSVAVVPSPVSVILGNTSTLAAVAKDAQGNTIAGKSATWSSATTAVATVSASGVVTGVALGTSVISATVDGVVGTSTVTVVSLPGGNSISVDPAQTFQTINGWEGTGSIGEVECDQTAFQNYKAPVIDRLANELGLNRVRLQVRSGYESPVDYFTQFRSGQITYAQWQATWYSPVNDNTNANNTDPTKFQWGWLDYQIDEVVVPLMAKLQARGEKLYVNLNYIDFAQGRTKSFIQIKQPQEYAEFIAAAFTHIKQKYGWSPDALEILLEPSNAGDVTTGVYGSDLGPAVVAAATRLSSLGFTPEIIAPSDASMSGSVSYYDQMILTPGALSFIKELSYHRYQGVSLAALQAIAFRGQRDHVRTAMLEWNQGVNIDTLIEDLTVGNVSAWQQFSMAYCAQATQPGATGIYYQVNQSNPSNPIVTMTNNARDYRQIFLYVRAGAVRIGATSGNPSVLTTVAFRNANGKHVAVVRSQSAAAFSITGLPAGTYGVNFNSFTQNGVNMPDVVVTGGGVLNAAAPSKGVMTFYQR
ncbi:MAG: Ig-like domain-containing protein [Gemmatimonadaceae bacterium]